VDLNRHCPPGQDLGPYQRGPRHPWAWLHASGPGLANRETVDGGHRSGWRGNRADDATGGRSPPGWCERGHGAALAALSGSQSHASHGRRRLRRGNLRSTSARTIPDLRHIRNSELDFRGHAGLASEVRLPGNARFEPKYRQVLGPSKKLAQNPEPKVSEARFLAFPPNPPSMGGFVVSSI
jgi:hypothetical protein